MLSCLKWQKQLVMPAKADLFGWKIQTRRYENGVMQYVKVLCQSFQLLETALSNDA